MSVLVNKMTNMNHAESFSEPRAFCCIFDHLYKLSAILECWNIVNDNDCAIHIYGAILLIGVKTEDASQAEKLIERIESS